MNLKVRLKIFSLPLAIALMFVAFAAICSAITDTLLFKFSTSVFKDLDPTWWNPMVSWMYKSGFIVFADSFHFFKSFMLFFGAAGFISVVLAGFKHGKELNTHLDWIDVAILVILLALDWNLIFNLCYSFLA